MKKKIQFPKIKKHLHNFLTDESGKISKHNALGFGAVGALMGMVDGADAHHCPRGNIGSSSPGTYIDNWSGGSNGTTYYTAGSICGHASNIWNGTRPYSEIAPFTFGTSVIRGNTPDLSGSSSYECDGTTNVYTSGGTNTYFEDCGEFTSSNNGHMSNMGTASSSTDSTTHTNVHNNY